MQALQLRGLPLPAVQTHAACRVRCKPLPCLAPPAEASSSNSSDGSGGSGGSGGSEPSSSTADARQQWGPPPTTPKQYQVYSERRRRRVLARNAPPDDIEAERRHKISEANAGRVPWNKGRKHSPETIEKIRETTKLAMQRKEVHERIQAATDARRGQKLPDEHKENIRTGLEKSRQELTPEQIEEREVERRQKCSEAMKRKWQDPEYRAMTLARLNSPDAAAAREATRSARAAAQQHEGGAEAKPKRAAKPKAEGQPKKPRARKPTKKELEQQAAAERAAVQQRRQKVAELQALVARTERVIADMEASKLALANDPQALRNATTAVKQATGMLHAVRVQIASLMAGLPEAQGQQGGKAAVEPGSQEQRQQHAEEGAETAGQLSREQQWQEVQQQQEGSRPPELLHDDGSHAGSQLQTAGTPYVVPTSFATSSSTSAGSALSYGASINGTSSNLAGGNGASMNGNGLNGNGRYGHAVDVSLWVPVAVAAADGVGTSSSRTGLAGGSSGQAVTSTRSSSHTGNSSSSKGGPQTSNRQNSGGRAVAVECEAATEKEAHGSTDQALAQHNSRVDSSRLRRDTNSIVSDTGSSDQDEVSSSDKQF